MKTLLTALTSIAGVALHAGPRLSTHYSITADVTDGGGGRAESALYSISGSTGGLASTGASGGPIKAAMSGFVGQLYEVVGFAMLPTNGPVNAGETAELAAGQLLDDGTFLEAPVSSSFQWYRDGEAIPDATSQRLVLASAQSFHAGEYAVSITNGTGPSVFLDPVVLAIGSPAPSTARLLNLSTRALSLTGENTLIPGFVLGGSAEKTVLIRAVGPTLADFGVGGVLEDPLLTLKRSIGNTTVDVAINDNWSDNTNVAELLEATTAVGAFDLAPGSADAALLATLEPGQYSVVTSGVAGGTGVAIVELYDADLAGTSASSLINISTRGFVGTGDQVMIPGFVVSSEGPKTLLIRAVGPTLGDFGLSGTLADPLLIVSRNEANGSSTSLLTQDNWGDSPDSAKTATVANQVGAFPLTTGSKDAAFVVTLAPGVYTVVGSSADGGSTGVALVEIYVVE